MVAFGLYFSGEAKKGGTSHELSSNLVWSLSDLILATKRIGQGKAEKLVQTAVKLIEKIKLVKN